MREKRQVVAVCARMGDPIYQTARARLIWAAQTAQAISELGGQVALVGSGASLPIKVDGPDGARALRRLVSGMYNVAGDFDIFPLYPPQEPAGSTTPYGKWEAEVLFPQYILPFVGLVHTRDPRVVRTCVKSGVPVIYEDHNEDYQLSEPGSDALLGNPMVRAVVAITTAVADRLTLMGVPRAKIIVQDSGVNSRAMFRFPTRATTWRNSLLRGGQEYLVVYTGGMQEERGIAHILSAAQNMPDVMFALAGGNNKDISYWIAQARLLNIYNVRFLDYLPQDQVVELQQAADAVIMTRKPGARGSITSPLKYFEYLASGTPIVSADLPILRNSWVEDLAVTWYDPHSPATLAAQLRASFVAYQRRSDGYAANIRQAARYSWEVRQRAIMVSAGVDAFLSEGVN